MMLAPTSHGTCLFTTRFLIFFLTVIYESLNFRASRRRIIDIYQANSLLLLQPEFAKRGLQDRHEPAHMSAHFARSFLFFNIVCPLVNMNRGFVQGLRSGESLRPLGLVCACLRKRSLVRCPCAFPLQVRVKSPLQVPCIDILKMTYSSCWCESSGPTLLYEIHVSLFYASFCRILLSEVSSKKPCQILPIASHSVTICRDSLRCLGANILVKRSLYEGLADAMYGGPHMNI